MIVRLKQIGIVSALVVVAAACGRDDSDADMARNDAAASVSAIAVNDAAVAPADTIIVYKSPTCGCCRKWVDHVEENGFAVVTHDLDDLSSTKRELGVPAGRVSCHTATVRGYTIEGHVPADLIRKLIAESPAGVRGLAVPGMPAGSPGMEGLFAQEYDVLAFDAEGNVEVYAHR